MGSGSESAGLLKRHTDHGTMARQAKRPHNGRRQHGHLRNAEGARDITGYNLPQRLQTLGLSPTSSTCGARLKTLHEPLCSATAWLFIKCMVLLSIEVFLFCLCVNARMVVFVDTNNARFVERWRQWSMPLMDVSPSTANVGFGRLLVEGFK